MRPVATMLPVRSARIYFVGQWARGIYGGRFRFACFYGAPQTFHDCGIRFRSRFLDWLGALRQRASKVSSRIIGSNYQYRGNQLSDERFDRRKHGKPHSHPRWNNVLQPANRCCRYPVGQLHLLRLFAYHHEQDHAEKNAGGDQHFAIRQTLLKNERKHRDHPRENRCRAARL